MGSLINHIGIILDGNRRFAESNNIDLEEVYRIAEDNVNSLVKWLLIDGRANILSIYALSLDNVVKRLSIDIDPVLDVQICAYEKWEKSKIMLNNGIRVIFAGELECLPQKYREACRSLEEQTEGCSKKKFYILVSYSGRLEICNAAEKFKIEGERNADWIRNEFFKYLYVKEPVDLVIRTAGEQRLSDFLPYQTSYSEYIFLKQYFPAMTKEDIEKAIAEYLRRKRNFGE